MFGGQWKEADENCVSIDIPDENIDEEGTCAVCVTVLYNTKLYRIILG